MSKAIEKDLVYYLSLPYVTTLCPDGDGHIIASMPELPGCVAHGDTEAEALDNLKVVKQAWLEECIETSQPIPEPSAEDEVLPSGKWLQRVPRSTHKQLTKMAEREGVSLNGLVCTLLADAIAGRTAIEQYAAMLAMPTRHWAEAWQDQAQMETTFLCCDSLAFQPGKLTERLSRTRRLIEDAKQTDPTEITRHRPKAISAR